MSEIDDIMSNAAGAENIIKCREMTKKNIRTYKNAGISVDEAKAIYTGILGSMEQTVLAPVTMIWIEQVYAENTTN